MTAGEMLLKEIGTLPELVRAHARARPRHPMVVLDDAVLDAATLDAQVDRVAAALQRDGV
ncbi:MAG: hypothetical protein QOI41_1651, partial [Myxococcales bacterium]|nr:hypothetical protein [Myxococcales bacterium]